MSAPTHRRLCPPCLLPAAVMAELLLQQEIPLDFPVDMEGKIGYHKCINTNSTLITIHTLDMACTVRVCAVSVKKTGMQIFSGRKETHDYIRLSGYETLI